jgi:hypothetical protein
VVGVMKPQDINVHVNKEDEREGKKKRGNSKRVGHKNEFV